MPSSPLAPEGLPYEPRALAAKLWARDVKRVPPHGELSIDGMSVSTLAQTFDTPLFVVSENDFRSRARAFRQAFDEAFAALCGGGDVYYAGKAFLCAEVARWVREEGLRLDTCSGSELLLAHRAGTPGEQLGLHGNNKTVGELARALDFSVGRIVVDSWEELEKLTSLAAQRGTQVKILLRVTPGVQAHTHEFIATAHEDQKFGLSLKASEGPSPAERAVLFAHRSPFLDLRGLHCHIGSQIFDMAGFALAGQRVLAFMAYLRDTHGVVLDELDLGGGYGIAYTHHDAPKTPENIARALAEVVAYETQAQGLPVPRISVEPGRSIAGPSTFTLYRVGTVKAIEVDLPDGSTAIRRYCAVDGGMSDNPRPLLYNAQYTAVLASRVSEARPVLSRVVGRHCESGDILVHDVYLPEDIVAGDLLAVPATGAYCWSLASNYNYQLRPAVVAVRDGDARILVRRETEEELLARDAGLSGR